MPSFPGSNPGGTGPQGPAGPAGPQGNPGVGVDPANLNAGTLLTTDGTTISSTDATVDDSTLDLAGRTLRTGPQSVVLDPNIRLSNTGDQFEMTETSAGLVYSPVLYQTESRLANDDHGTPIVAKPSYKVLSPTIETETPIATSPDTFTFTDMVDVPASFNQNLRIYSYKFRYRPEDIGKTLELLVRRGSSTGPIEYGPFRFTVTQDPTQGVPAGQAIIDLPAPINVRSGDQFNFMFEIIGGGTIGVRGIQGTPFLFWLERSQRTFVDRNLVDTSDAASLSRGFDHTASLGFNTDFTLSYAPATSGNNGNPGPGSIIEFAGASQARTVTLPSTTDTANIFTRWTIENNDGQQLLNVAVETGGDRIVLINQTGITTSGIPRSHIAEIELVNVTNSVVIYNVHIIPLEAAAGGTIGDNTTDITATTTTIGSELRGQPWVYENTVTTSKHTVGLASTLPNLPIGHSTEFTVDNTEAANVLRVNNPNGNFNGMGMPFFLVESGEARVFRAHRTSTTVEYTPIGAVDYTFDIEAPDLLDNTPSWVVIDADYRDILNNGTGVNSHTFVLQPQVQALAEVTVQGAHTWEGTDVPGAGTPLLSFGPVIGTTEQDVQVSSSIESRQQRPNYITRTFRQFPVSAGNVLDLDFFGVSSTNRFLSPRLRIRLRMKQR